MGVSYETILSKNPIELVAWLEQEFTIEIPENLDSVE